MPRRASWARRDLMVAVSCLLFVPTLHVFGQPVRPTTALAVDEMSFAAGAEVAVTVSPDGLVGFLRTTPGAPIPLDARGSAEERARGFLGVHGRAFGFGSGVEAEVMRVSPVDDLGMEHVRFRQTWRGIPVTGGELSVHLRGATVVAANAKTLGELTGVETVPLLTAAEAASLVRAALQRSHGVTDAVLSEPRLEILSKGLLEGRRSLSAELTWFIEAREVDLREYLWVSARAPKVVLQFSQLTDALDRQVYDANDPGDSVFNNLPGTLVRSEGGPAVAGPAAADANAAYDYAGDTYDYFFDELGRDSYDDAGASLISTVRFCPNASPDCPYLNAFWNGVQMVYGSGFSAADDVVAHELTHAVTEHTANLFYYMQSGALNESYSDIFGETVDQLNAAGTDTVGVQWKMGEDVPVFGAIRDMADPTILGDPGKLSDNEFFCGDDYKLDGGGVHSNSGVPNKAYYLMVEGDSYNGEVISGIGLAKAGRIQYRALSRYLLSASDFLDNDNALRQSCQDLIGSAGITAADCSEVGKALDAVEMAEPWACLPTQVAVPAFCPVGQGPDLWYYGDFDAAIGGLATCPSVGVSTAWCRNDATSLLGSFATSGEGSLWGYNQPVISNIGQGFVFNVMPPANARLQFNHSHGFENDLTTNYDGGLVVYTTNGGSNWFNGGGLISAGQGYGGTISNSFGNPLGTLSAFVRDSWGYTATQLDLGSLSGTAFGYGFQIGTDSAVDDYGWFIDDVRIYTCPTCLTHRVLDGDYSGMAPHYKASGTITAGDGFTVPFGDAVTLEAGTSVTLTDGFTAVGDLTVITGSACP